MGATFSIRKVEPTVLAQAVFDYPSISWPTLVGDEYFIVGRVISGARFYSEPLFESEVEDAIEKYIATVTYFGGGIVEVYNVRGDLIRSEVAVDFDI